VRQVENALLRVRPATRADVSAIEELIARSARALSDGFYTAPQVESLLRFVFGTDTQLIDDGTYLLAEREDPLLDPGSEPARIRAFFVDPAAARQGVGRRLFDECRCAAAAAGFRTLTLVATLPGEPLYQALGFTVTERFQLRLPDGLEIPVARMSRHVT
jgi:GNAT superfamily N-acetyltransferase